MKKSKITYIFAVVTIVSLTVAILTLINQKNLNHIIDMQNAKIDTLIAQKKDLQFGKQINNDSNLTSLEDIKSMVKQLNDKTEVLGTSTISAGITVPTPVGMISLNSGITMVNIYESPSISATILSSTMPAPILFYYQKQSGFHLVEYSENHTGWVPDDQLTEVQ